MLRLATPPSPPKKCPLKYPSFSCQPPSQQPEKRQPCGGHGSAGGYREDNSPKHRQLTFKWPLVFIAGARQYQCGLG